MESAAIIGAGWAGARHAQAFKKLGVKIAWVVDTRLERAESLAADLPGEVRVSASYRDALGDPQVSAVDICLPHHLHAEAAVAAARAGKHILVEKPLAASLDEADQMIEAARAGGVVLMVAENALFNPLYHKVQGLLRNGLIGKPALLQMAREAYLARSFLEERPWFLDARAAAGGIMMSGGVHDFSTAMFLLGDIESVYALRAPQRFLEMEGDDTSLALLRFKNGVVGSIVESFIMKSLVTAAGPEVHTLRIDGELGSIQVPDGRTIRLFSEREDMRLRGDPVQQELYVSEQDTFELEIAHFLDCIRGGREPITSGEVMRRPLEVVLAAYRSMETGKAELIP